MPSILGYWKPRGITNPIRMLLEYTGEDYEAVFIEPGPPPEYGREHWYEVRDTLGLDFPNLPYYKDGDVRLTQSYAILRYIAHKYNLEGDTVEERRRVLQIAEEASEMMAAMVRLSYNPDFEKLKEEYLSNARRKFKEVHTFLGDRTWMAGEKITFVDFAIYEVLVQHRTLDPSCLGESRTLEDFIQRVNDLPAIKAYMASDRYVKWPFWSRTAAWANDPDKMPANVI